MQGGASPRLNLSGGGILGTDFKSAPKLSEEAAATTQQMGIFQRELTYKFPEPAHNRLLRGVFHKREWYFLNLLMVFAFSKGNLSQCL